ncbi:MAG: ABC transporter permease [Bacteroidetes bacterium]|nr:ABC transporter permease [Bacteroidota bacterium]
MNNLLVWQLAIRYLRGKRRANIVPVLSRISMAAIAVGAGAMIVMFSVFNGFEYLVRDLYKAFYPEIKISAAKGKFFTPSPEVYNTIKSIGGVNTYTNVIEDQVILNSEQDTRIASIKGIDRNYLAVNNVKPYITEGRDSVSAWPVATAIVGTQLLAGLGLDVNNVFSTMILYYPNADADVAQNPLGAFQSLKLRADGAFKIQDEFDEKFILASLPLVQQLFGQPGKYSSIELKLDKDADAEDIKQSLQAKLGSAYKIETRFEQNKTIYMVMRTEKWAIYAILLLVLLIASFNIGGTLSLLVLEKQKDMAILKAMGAENKTIRNIFIMEGMLWSLTGGLIGLTIGALICAGQYYFHWIKLGGSYIIEAYPVHMLATDFLVIIATIIAIGILAAWLPASRSVKVSSPSLRSN